MDGVGARGVALGFAVAAFMACIAEGIMGAGPPGSLFRVSVQSAHVESSIEPAYIIAPCVHAGTQMQQPHSAENISAATSTRWQSSINSSSDNADWSQLDLPLGPDFVGGDEDAGVEWAEGDGEVAYDMEDVLGMWEETFTHDTEEYHRWLDAQVELALGHGAGAEAVPTTHLRPVLGGQRAVGPMDVGPSSATVGTSTGRMLAAHKLHDPDTLSTACTTSRPCTPGCVDAPAEVWRRHTARGPVDQQGEQAPSAGIGAWTIGRALLQLGGTRLNVVSGITQRNIAFNCSTLLGLGLEACAEPLCADVFSLVQLPNGTVICRLVGTQTAVTNPVLFVRPYAYDQLFQFGSNIVLFGTSVGFQATSSLRARTRQPTGNDVYAYSNAIGRVAAAAGSFLGIEATYSSGVYNPLATFDASTLTPFTYRTLVAPVDSITTRLARRITPGLTSSIVTPLPGAQYTVFGTTGLPWLP